MRIISLSLYYFSWHYSHAFRNIFGVWSNFLWFVYHFFSVPILFATLFAPWKRMQEERDRVFDLERIASAIVVNVVMRIVGFFVRSIFIIIGMVALVTVVVFGVVFYIFWVLAPFIVVIVLIAGFINLFI